MCAFVEPLPIPDHFRNLPGSTHKKMSDMHPLEIHLRELKQSQDQTQYDTNKAIYGIGFADHLLAMQDVISSTEIVYTTTHHPSHIGTEIFTGKINQIDLPDKFTPNGFRSDVEYEPHTLNEQRFNINTINY